jgi:hypothetical protein
MLQFNFPKLMLPNRVFKKRCSNTLQTQIIVIGTPSKHLQLSLCGDYTAHRIATGMQWNTCQWNSAGQSGVIEVYRHDVHYCPWTPLSLWLNTQLQFFWLATVELKETKRSSFLTQATSYLRSSIQMEHGEGIEQLKDIVRIFNQECKFWMGINHSFQKLGFREICPETLQLRLIMFQKWCPYFPQRIW